LARHCDGDSPAFDIVSMSFGGFISEDDPPIALASGIATIQSRYNTVNSNSSELTSDRVLFVASAGNQATCRPAFPAALENVIAVGALGVTGAAGFTNFGPWVNACAPGVDIISTFFDLGDEASFNDHEFDGWASWSGTSFSCPAVVAQIAWEWMSGAKQSTPGDAAQWLLDRPDHHRIRGLGTVVNIL
jgi:subtilisin family serine protease